jgi:hypothetical protein
MVLSTATFEMWWSKLCCFFGRWNVHTISVSDRSQFHDNSLANDSVRRSIPRFYWSTMVIFKQFFANFRFGCFTIQLHWLIKNKREYSNLVTRGKVPDVNLMFRSELIRAVSARVTLPRTDSTGPESWLKWRRDWTTWCLDRFFARFPHSLEDHSCSLVTKPAISLSQGRLFKSKHIIASSFCVLLFPQLQVNRISIKNIYRFISRITICDHQSYPDRGSVSQVQFSVSIIPSWASDTFQVEFITFW